MFVDEVCWGFFVIENLLWEVVFDFMCEFDGCLNEDYKVLLLLDVFFVQFSFWMGGDRDGNLFVMLKVIE